MILFLLRQLLLGLHAVYPIHMVPLPGLPAQLQTHQLGQKNSNRSFYELSLAACHLSGHLRVLMSLAQMIPWPMTRF